MKRILMGVTVLSAAVLVSTTAQATDTSARATPGQNGVPAVAPREVVLTPASGVFPSGSPDYVRLISNDNGDWDNLQDVVATKALIKGNLPEYGPGTGDEGETFRITAKFGSLEFTADPVRVTALTPGSGYPPTM